MCDPIAISKIRPTPPICFAFDLLRRTSALSDCSATFVHDRQMEIDREISLRTVPYPAMIQSDKRLTSPSQKSELGLFHCRDGFQKGDLLPLDLSKKYCTFFCFHNKKCSKPNQACDFEHVGRWEKFPPEDQEKILAHFHAGKGEKAWLDAETFAKHNVTIPEKYAYLLGDASGCKST
jgi:hypothetical protein